MDEIEETLPNGFHDSQITSIRIDYEARMCVFRMCVDVGESDGDIEIVLTSLQYLVVGAPDSTYPFRISGAERVTGVVTTDEILPSLESLRDQLPSGSFFYSFFVNSWNSFIHVGAMDADLRWL